MVVIQGKGRYKPKEEANGPGSAAAVIAAR
jgi:hypothetical protein